MPTFLNNKDIEYFKSINKEIYQLYFFPVKIYYIKIKEFDKVFGEDQNKSFYDPVEVEAYIPDLPEWQNYTTKLGMDELRTLKAFFSIDLMNERGLKLPEAGDQIEIQNDMYLVTQSNPIDYGSNLQIPLSHIVELKRIRFERPDAGTRVYKAY